MPSRRRAHYKMFCKVCFDAGKSKKVFTSHFVRESRWWVAQRSCVLCFCKTSVAAVEKWVTHRGIVLVLVLCNSQYAQTYTQEGKAIRYSCQKTRNTHCTSKSSSGGHQVSCWTNESTREDEEELRGSRYSCQSA